MKKIMFFALLVVFILGIVVVPGYCQEMEKKSYKATGRPEAYIIDVLVARPIGILACAVGFGGLIVSAPFAAMSGTSEQAFDAFLTEPGEYTFTRPLGQFD
ncbi:MAG: hypothetical protein A4E64_02328 [Syntrophorhabdus sp. PtaU1.Bin058]|nr:MAG: hypothetical protein A4E64_02328 [Syntrophorhabdus sp. PtaU1.Bin058]